MNSVFITHLTQNKCQREHAFVYTYFAGITSMIMTRLMKLSSSYKNNMSFNYSDGAKKPLRKQIMPLIRNVIKHSTTPLLLVSSAGMIYQMMPPDCPIYKKLRITGSEFNQ